LTARIEVNGAHRIQRCASNSAVRIEIAAPGKD
jgi:hypothetical protein